jgi:hypothetical protein
LNDPFWQHHELTLGRRKLSTIFGNSRPLTLKAAELLGPAHAWSDGIYQLHAG